MGALEFYDTGSTVYVRYSHASIIPKDNLYYYTGILWQGLIIETRWVLHIYLPGKNKTKTNKQRNKQKQKNTL